MSLVVSYFVLVFKAMLSFIITLIMLAVFRFLCGSNDSCRYVPYVMISSDDVLGLTYCY